jgi:hypothetical protein
LVTAGVRNVRASVKRKRKIGPLPGQEEARYVHLVGCDYSPRLESGAGRNDVDFDAAVDVADGFEFSLVHGLFVFATDVGFGDEAH